MRISRRSKFAAILCLSLTTSVASAQVFKDPERAEDYVRVVQKSPFGRAGRFSAAPTFGLTINDPLLQQFLVGVNLNYFFIDSLAIQAQFHYSFDSKRSSQNALLANQLRPEINPVQFLGSLGVEYVPIYGKFSLFNGPIVYWDAYLSGGAGVVNTSKGGIAPTGVITVGSRLFLTPWLTLLFEFRDFLYQEEFATTAGQRTNFVNNLVFSVGVSFFLPTRSGN